MAKLIIVRVHLKLVFWTYVLEKYHTFLNLNTRRTSDLNQDRWIHKRMVAAEDGAADKADFSTDDVTKEVYSSKVRLITDDWEGSSKSAFYICHHECN